MSEAIQTPGTATARMPLHNVYSAPSVSHLRPVLDTPAEHVIRACAPAWATLAEISRECLPSRVRVVAGDRRRVVSDDGVPTDL
jgi:hypothetical protein